MLPKQFASSDYTKHVGDFPLGHSTLPSLSEHANYLAMEKTELNELKGRDSARLSSRKMGNSFASSIFPRFCLKHCRCPRDPLSPAIFLPILANSLSAADANPDSNG